MSTFHYKKKGSNKELNGVQCDICRKKLYTDTPGKLFGEHVRDAKKKGWVAVKWGDKWLNLCPECIKAEEERQRDEYFEKGPIEKIRAEIEGLAIAYYQSPDYKDTRTDEEKASDCWKMYKKLVLGIIDKYREG